MFSLHLPCVFGASFSFVLSNCRCGGAFSHRLITERDGHQDCLVVVADKYGSALDSREQEEGSQESQSAERQGRDG